TRRLGGNMCGRAGRPPRGGRAAGPRLQSGPRRAARDRTGPAAPARRLRTRAVGSDRERRRGGRVTSTEQPGVLLMTYGSPASLDGEDIRAYLARVRSGREPDPQLVDEFTRRYRVIGGSPLVEITRAQAGAVADSLGW